MPNVSGFVSHVMGHRPLRADDTDSIGVTYLFNGAVVTEDVSVLIPVVDLVVQAQPSMAPRVWSMR